MEFQTVFKRYELKYLLTLDEKQRVLEAMERYMELDKFKRSTVRNVYLDTKDHRLIRRSMEKPEYKEKLRIRSYCRANEDSTVFVELKKKYRSVVYKRRMAMSQRDAEAWLFKKAPCPADTQISREISYFLFLYRELEPKVFLSYEREAYYDKSGGDLRVTFDDNILCRQRDISLCSEVYGDRLLDESSVLMELKCSGGIPLWLVKVLSRERIYKTSFSKYGTAYEKYIFPEICKKAKGADKNGNDIQRDI
ncbi:MAG: polyphosphate polymerase domain-containing protein [Ruminococcaceae bacterium]|nr:polyphosphate polymerase domain-containing protein [Oscillospiraceae bacterium]